MAEIASNRIKTFYPFVGSIPNYQQNLHLVLTAIKSDRLAPSEVARFAAQKFDCSREFSRKVIDALKGLGLIALKRGVYKVTDIGKQYMNTNESHLICQSLISRVLGVEELFKILSERQYVEKSALPALFAEVAGFTLPRNQIDHRVNWMRAFGCVDMVSGRYLLKDQGLKFFSRWQEEQAKTREEKRLVSHREVEKRLKIVGEFFEFQTDLRPSVNSVLPSYALKLAEGDRQIDCLWVRYVHFAGKIKFPIEVHLEGNLADTLDRLETVSEYVQKAIIITTEEQEKRILDRLKVKKSRLLDKLVIVGVDDLYKAVEATSVLKSFSEKLFHD